MSKRKSHFPPPKLEDVPSSPNRVRVTKPNEVGEIISRVIPARDFRPRPPKHPGDLDPNRIDWISRGDREGVTARSVLYVFKHREAEIAYWEHFACHLTRAEQRHLAGGESTSILRPIRPAWKPGDRMYVARDMEAEVVEVSESPRGYGTVFKVHDHRVLYLKRGVIGSDTPKTDEHGYPPELTDAEKEKARIESSYIGSATQAIDDAGAVMTDEEYQRIHSEQSASNALEQRKARVKLTRQRLQERLKEARAKNRRSTVRYLERQIEHLDGKLDKAA